jgi:hypothetical protein
VIEEGDRVVAHVGLLEIPIRIMGRDLLVGGVHGAATDPRHRRQGHFRALFNQLAGFAGSRYEFLILTTLNPEFFVSFGFCVVPETIGVAGYPRRLASVARRLDFANGADLALIHRLIESRTPLSDRFGIGPEKCCWGFVEFGSIIRYAEAADVAVVGEVIDRTLRIYDVLGASVPGAAEIASMWEEPFDRILFFVPTDKIAGDIVTSPHDLSGGPDALEPGTANWVMMIRGPSSLPGPPIFLPRPARC